MPFTSLVFLFLFLPFALLGSILIVPKLKKPLLLLASLIFYAWGGVSFVSVLIGFILINFIIGILIGRSDAPLSRKIWFITGIILNISGLLIFKYSNFMVDNLNLLVSLLRLNPLKLNEVFLPLGISFITLRGISYLVTVYKKETPPQKNIIDVGLYLGFFPTLPAGPVERYKPFISQLDHLVTNMDLFASGVRRFALGLVKTLIIAAALGRVADQIFNNSVLNLNAPLAWLGAITFMLQIYYGFSGYVDLAIALGRMFGLRLSENFNFPYTAVSIRDFWTRWHITLATWLRDYLFLPLSYSISGKLKRERYLGLRVNNFIFSLAVLITFICCGFWHGADWNFIVWGLIFGLLLVFERTSPGKKLIKGPSVFSHIYTLFFVLIAWVIFRSPDLNHAFRFLGLMTGFETGNPAPGKFIGFFNTEFVLMIIIAVAGCTRIFAMLKNKLESIITAEGKYASVIFNVYNLTALIVVVLVLAFTSLTLISSPLLSFIGFRF